MTNYSSRKATSLLSLNAKMAAGGKAHSTTRPAGFRATMSKNIKVKRMSAVKMFCFFIFLTFLTHFVTATLPLAETIRSPEEIKACRQVVLNDLLDSERAHVAEIRGLLENFLEPLASAQM